MSDVATGAASVAEKAGKIVWTKMVPYFSGMGDRLAQRLMGSVYAELQKDVPEIAADHVALIKKWIGDADFKEFAGITGLSKFILTGADGAVGIPDLFSRLASVLASPVLVNMLMKQIPSLSVKITTNGLLAEEIERISEVVRAVLNDKEATTDPLEADKVNSFLADLKRAELVPLTVKQEDIVARAKFAFGKFLDAFPVLQQNVADLVKFIKEVDVVTGVCVVGGLTFSPSPESGLLVLEKYGHVTVLTMLALISCPRPAEFLEAMQFQLNVTGPNDPRILLGFYARRFGDCAIIPPSDMPCCACMSLDFAPISRYGAASYGAKAAMESGMYCRCDVVEANMKRLDLEAGAPMESTNLDAMEDDEMASEDDLEDVLESTGLSSASLKRGLPRPELRPRPVPSTPIKKSAGVLSPAAAAARMEALSSWIGGNLKKKVQFQK